MKVSLVITTLNEEKTIGRLLDSLAKQTKRPDEIIIVDGGSSDRTVEKIKKYAPEVKLVIKKEANRAQGRNEAIKRAQGEVIAITDAGCILAKNWLEEIAKPFDNPEVEVVAGYYQAKVKTVFEKCVVPYALVMPDRVDAKNFLPASRSMAIRKKIWQKAGGFPEKFSDNEDYVFAQNLKKAGTKIVFNPKAIAFWLPRSDLKDFFVMIYRFARGDAFAGLRYGKTASIFARYLLGFLLLVLLLVTDHWSLVTASLFIAGCLLIYSFWSIAKNYRFVKNWRAIFVLPALQIVSDWAVMLGFLSGIIERTKRLKE